MTQLNYARLAPSWMAIIIDSMGFGLVYPLMTALFAGEQGSHMAEGLSIGLRHFYLGLSFLLYPLFMFFGASFLGDLSDIWGRKKVLLICMFGLAISLLLMGLGVSLLDIPLLMLGRALSGLMAGSQPIAQAAISDLSTEKTKARNLSFTTFVICVGIVVGPLIGGLFSDSKIVSWFTLSTPFYVVSLLSFATALWIWISFKETFFERGYKSLNWMRPFHIFLEGLQHSRVFYLSIAFFFMQVGFSLYFQLIQVLLSTYFNYASWQLGVFNGYIGLSFAFVLLIGSRYFLKYWNVESVAISTLFLTGVGILLSMLFPFEISIWVLAFFVAGLDMVAYACMMTIFSNAVDKKSQGWVMGIFYSVMSLSWALTGLSTNLILTVGLRGLISIGGLAMLISALLMLFYNMRGYILQRTT